jgi:hypothetical protein
MKRRYSRAATIALMLALAIQQNSRAIQQSNPPRQTPDAAEDSQESQRREIIESDRWRRANRTFNEWLSVQQVYPPEQVAVMRAEFAAKVSRMSPRELEDFLKDMEERLEVLMSPAAEDARQWLAQFLAVARNPEAKLGRSRPDVLNMTASQIRQELQWLQQHRAARQQSQAAFNQGRALQQQTARGVQGARRQAQGRAGDNRSRAAANQFRSPYAPRPHDLPNTSDLRPIPVGPTVYTIGPWGTPVYWHPMIGQW